MIPGYSSDVIYKEVVVIGNGPSGITLSYLLSGHLPYLVSNSHPDEMLSERLESALGECLLNQDLDYLAAGLEGRSINPISLLTDALLHPCADLGIAMAPLIKFRRTGVELNHVVLGKGPPGGSWHKMDPYILTLSLDNWMALPGREFHSRDSGENRAFACNVANYYVDYVREMGLESNFVSNVNVTSVKPLSNNNNAGNNEHWLVETQDSDTGERTFYMCRYLVLATGASDSPNRLHLKYSNDIINTIDSSVDLNNNIVGNDDVVVDPEWLFHDLRTLETRLDAIGTDEYNMDPVLIMGAGLSAADAVVAVRGRNIPVVHVFRNKSADLNRQLPENMYPEYHKVHQMMRDGGSRYPFYTAYPEYTLSAIDAATRTVTLCTTSGNSWIKLRVSFAAVLIGARPDLSFMPQEYHLGRRINLPVDCKTNPVAIDKTTYRVDGHVNLFAVGPLAGDNFVRFIPGGAIGAVSDIYKEMALRTGKNSDGGREKCTCCC